MKPTPDDSPALILAGLLLIMAGSFLLVEPFVDPPRDDLNVIIGLSAVALGVAGIFRGAELR